MEACMTHFEAYEDMAGKWRWRMVAENHLVIASSGETFDSQREAIRAAETIRENAGRSFVSVVPGLSVKTVLRRLIQREDARRSRLSLGEA
jgi:uncharacterized protein YegP (UPF0339 family)